MHCDLSLLKRESLKYILTEVAFLELSVVGYRIRIGTCVAGSQVNCCCTAPDGNRGCGPLQFGEMLSLFAGRDGAAEAAVSGPGFSAATVAAMRLARTVAGTGVVSGSKGGRESRDSTKAIMSFPTFGFLS